MVFPMPNGAPVDDDSFSNHGWRPIPAPGGAALRQAAHSAAHVCWLADRSREPLKYLQEQLGHYSPAFTLAVSGHLLPRGDRSGGPMDDATIRNPRATDDRTSGTIVGESEQIPPRYLN